MLIVITGQPPNVNAGARRAKTFHWLALEAAKHRLPLYVVQPTNVVLKNGLPQRIAGVKATRFGTSWLPVQTDIVNPVWIDFMYLGELKNQRSRFRTLRRAIRRHASPFLNAYPLQKDSVYRILSESDLGPGCIPTTKTVAAQDDVHSFLAQHGTGWLKPVSGSGARNIVRIEKQNAAEYAIHSDSLKGKRVVKTLTRKRLTHFVRRQIKARKYVIQEEVQLPQLRDGRRLDFRVTVQRDLHGQWVVTATTLRRSAPGAYVTNFHAGGAVRSLGAPAAGEWLRSANLTDKDRYDAEYTALQTARALQKVYPQLAYLGVDVAPAEGCCYVYDCNSRPGRDILTDQEVRRMIERLVGFVAFLRSHQPMTGLSPAENLPVQVSE